MYMQLGKQPGDKGGRDQVPREKVIVIYLYKYIAMVGGDYTREPL